LEAELITDIWTIIQVILLDLALGGDNSIVIGMLPHELQKKAILYGTAGAIVLRFFMAMIVVYLLQIPYLHTVGGLLLVYIGMKLIGKQDGEEEAHVEAKDSLGGAVKTIIVADALMSLDNVLGIVATWDFSSSVWLSPYLLSFSAVRSSLRLCTNSPYSFILAV